VKKRARSPENGTPRGAKEFSPQKNRGPARDKELAGGKKNVVAEWGGHRQRGTVEAVLLERP